MPVAQVCVSLATDELRGSLLCLASHPRCEQEVRCGVNMSLLQREPKAALWSPTICKCQSILSWSVGYCVVSSCSHAPINACFSYRVCLLEMFGVDDFFVCASSKCMVHIQIYELSDHSDRTIGKNELGTSGMMATEVLKVSNRAVGCMV